MDREDMQWASVGVFGGKPPAVACVPSEWVHIKVFREPSVPKEKQ